MSRSGVWRYGECVVVRKRGVVRIAEHMLALQRGFGHIFRSIGRAGANRTVFPLSLFGFLPLRGQRHDPTDIFQLVQPRH